jgi:hypothetical protein
VFGTPSPANGSTGNPLSLSWSIPINDPEGDIVVWSMYCNNRQIKNEDGTNGTKLLLLTNLAPSITYTVWVSATDPFGSKRYTERWYTFTTSLSNEWYYLPPVPNYAPNGLPDFDQNQQNDWKDLEGHQALNGSVCLADILWWFDSQHENQSGHPGDGNDTYPLVQNYHAPGVPTPGPHSDDHNHNNVNDIQTPYLKYQQNGELIERIAWYANRQKDMSFYTKLGPLKEVLNTFTLIYGAKKWLVDCNLQNNYSVIPILRPSFSTINTYLRNNAGIILGIVPDNTSSFFSYGHFVAVAGINSLGYIAVSDPAQDRMNFNLVPYKHNNASIVSHDAYRVNLTSPYPGLASWWLPDYRGGGELIIGAIIISEKT